MIDAALDYARRGHRVLPDIGKRPPIKDWQKLASCDPRQIEQWWQQWPNANVGLLCGHRFVVVDVDPRHGGDAALAELTAKHGPLPETAKVATGGGGWHHYFAAQGVASRDLAKGVELRATGRQVVAPPSIHPDTGREYVWLARSPLAPMPGWLVDLSITDGPAGPRGAAPSSVWLEMLENGIPDGGRNVDLTALTGHLLRHYIAVDVVAALVHMVNESRCFPPKPRDEVDRIIESLAGRELARRERKQK